MATLDIVRALRPLLRRHPKMTLAVITTGVLSALAEGVGISLFIPFLHDLSQASLTETGSSFGDALGNLFVAVPPDRRLLVIAVCIFGSIFLKATLTYGHRVLYHSLDADIGHHLRSGLFEQLLSVRYDFLERGKSGDFLNTLSTETWRTSQALSTLLGLIITISTLAVYAALLLLISWQLTLVAAAAMLVIAGLVRIITRRVKQLGMEATRANAALADRMLEGLAGMRIIRAFTREPFEQKRFDDRSRRVRNIFLRLDIISGLANPVYEILAAALVVSILYASLQDPGHLPGVLVFIFVLYRLQPQTKALDNARINLHSLAGAVENVNALLSREGKPYLTSGSTTHRSVDEAISFENVTFRYDEVDSPALENVSLRIRANQTTALVGPSGSGKSTLIKLIFRFYDPTSGTIFVDRQPLRDLDLASWRARIAFVNQEGYLFNTTVRENIAYGNLDATHEEIVEAARQAEAHTFISELPRGYDTDVGDGGLRLSGGQRQRISLARALVREPDVLILDEATNAIDSISEDLIQKALTTIRRDCTVIVIAHRLASVSSTDHIIVLDRGRVCEEGDFRQLCESGGLFAQLYDLEHASPSAHARSR